MYASILFKFPTTFCTFKYARKNSENRPEIISINLINIYMEIRFGYTPRMYPDTRKRRRRKRRENETVLKTR